MSIEEAALILRMNVSEEADAPVLAFQEALETVIFWIGLTDLTMEDIYEFSMKDFDENGIYSDEYFE